MPPIVIELHFGRAGYAGQVRGSTRLIRSPHGLKTKIYWSVIFFPVWIGLLKSWVIWVKSAGSWVWPVIRLY
jgi:hypothetical protein